MRPRITEKASTQSGGNSYTFEVARHANKIQIKQAIKEVYNVEPVKVNVISMKPKQKIVRNTLGKTSSYKKAVVFLKDGDTIEFI
ncbi:MAG: 50S ribosomal protein L23 [Parcubacteria group bacterium]|nr:50S ribosomal protein L23 [Parcubacteria group bacterium]